MELPVRRCTRCILPETYPDASFDERGVCRVCREYDSRYSNIDWGEREARLRRILGRYRRRGGTGYDCLVPLSGGRDSTYTLMLLRRVYGMNPLALHVDNGFACRSAAAGARRVARDLGVDFISYGPSRDLLYRVYAQALEKTGDFCMACVALVATTSSRFADMHGIRLIVSGFDERTEAPPPEFAYLDRVCFWNVMKSRFRRSELARDYMFPTIRRMLGIRQISMPDHLPWDRAAIDRELERELGVRRTAADSRRDCFATPVSDYIFRLRSGFGKFEYLYAGQVRAGCMGREEALEQAVERGSSVSAEGVGAFLSLIGCDRSVLEGIGDRSIFDFRTRNRTLRRLASRVRELLP
jgi:hypothetical protein